MEGAPWAKESPGLALGLRLLVRKQGSRIQGFRACDETIRRKP
ncbi:MAG: hypothetical protein ABSE95_07165 [Thermodesulfobacteriota bacterium]